MDIHNQYQLLASIESAIIEHGQSKTLSAVLKDEVTLSAIINEDGTIDMEALKAIKGVVELKITIMPGMGFGGVKLKMDKEKINKSLGEPKSHFNKPKDAKGSIDNYGTFHIHYTEKNKVEALEVWLDGEGSIILNKKDIAKMKYDALLKLVTDMDKDVIVKKGHGFKSISKGIDVGADKDNKLTSIIIASKDYIKSLKGR